MIGVIYKDFTFTSGDGLNIFVYNWLPESGELRGIVQIAHGMAETAERYEKFASELTHHGYIVYANDHRGHGKTAGSIEELGYLADEDGFNWLVKDQYELHKLIKRQHPDLPLFLFGHSMGSFIAQKYIMHYGNELKGLILSGSNGNQGIMLSLGSLLAKREIKKYGARKQSARLDKLSFGSFNKSFRPNRTKFDWLSRDEVQVDKYIDNPYCGTVFTAGFFYDFFRGLKEIEDKRNFVLVPKDLPIYIFSGDKDPVGKFGRGTRNLLERYKKIGVKDIEFKLYRGGRHEMLNEINRDQVFGDIIQWLDKHL